MEDYIIDLVSQGKTREEAAKEANNQFNVIEFSSLSKNTMIFNLHAHYYYGGYACFALLGGLLLILIHANFPLLLLLVGGYTILAYRVGFIGLFFIYKLADIILYKKMKD